MLLAAFSLARRGGGGRRNCNELGGKVEFFWGCVLTSLLAALKGMSEITIKTSSCKCMADS